MVVESKIDDLKALIINGYGPQEGNEVEATNFMNKIDFEVKSAKLAGALICIEIDANSKLGKDIIKGDPKEPAKKVKTTCEWVKCV